MGPRTPDPWTWPECMACFNGIPSLPSATRGFGVAWNAGKICAFDGWKFKYIPQKKTYLEPPKNKAQTHGFFRVPKKLPPQTLRGIFTSPSSPIRQSPSCPVRFQFPFLPVEGHQGMGIFPIITIQRLTQLLQGNLTSSRSARFLFRNQRNKKTRTEGSPGFF